MDFVLFIKDNFLGAKDNIIFAHGETEKNLLSKIPGTEDYIYQTSLLYNGLKSGLLVFFFFHTEQLPRRTIPTQRQGTALRFTVSDLCMSW